MFRTMKISSALVLTAELIRTVCNKTGNNEKNNQRTRAPLDFPLRWTWKVDLDYRVITNISAEDVAAVLEESKCKFY